MNASDQLTVALTMTRCDLKKSTDAVTDVQMHVIHAAGVFRLISEGLETGRFTGRDTEFAGLYELMSIALDQIAATKCEDAWKLASGINEAAGTAPMVFPVEQGACHVHQ